MKPSTSSDFSFSGPGTFTTRENVMSEQDATSSDPFDLEHLSRLQAEGSAKGGEAKEPSAIPPVLEWGSTDSSSDAIKQQRL
jgi:hypothetical protein